MTGAEKSTAILLFAHGSSVEEANRSVRELARQVELHGPHPYVRAAFLECASPDLAAAVSEAADTGCCRVIVIPYFLTLGLHLRRDLPRLLAAQKAKFPQLEIEAGPPLEGHPLMTSIILERVEETLTELRTPR